MSCVIKFCGLCLEYCNRHVSQFQLLSQLLNLRSTTLDYNSYEPNLVSLIIKIAFACTFVPKKDQDENCFVTIINSNVYIDNYSLRR